MMKRSLALGIAAIWALLLGIQVVDAFEDAQTGPEPVDILIAQALATPSEPPTTLFEAQVPTPASPDKVLSSAWVVPALPSLGMSNPHDAIQITASPLLRTEPPLLQPVRM